MVNVSQTVPVTNVLNVLNVINVINVTQKVVKKQR